MKILTLIAVYLPGYKAGGPVRSLSGMVEKLGDTFEFWILTGDRDLNDTQPYPDIPLGQWTAVGKAQVYYADLSNLSLRALSKLIGEVSPSIVYLNSFFSSLSNKYLLARRLGMIPQIPTIVAPRGVFSRGALRLKSTKKRLYLMAVQQAGLLDGFRWQASSAVEKKDILDSLSHLRESDITVAPDLINGTAGDSEPSEGSYKLVKEPGYVRFVFLSRISAMKNLDFALSLLGSLTGNVEFDIFGPIEDRPYWNNCQQVIARLPGNVSVQLHGAVPHEEVGEILRRSHFFLLPTLGENFGHAILEALQAGRPVLISDRTSWNDVADLEAGWVTSLENTDQWIDVLQNCVDMGHDVYTTYAENAGRYAERWLSSTKVLQANIDMFTAIAGGIER